MSRKLVLAAALAARQADAEDPALWAAAAAEWDRIGQPYRAAHVTNLLRKLGVPNRAAAWRLCVE